MNKTERIACVFAHEIPDRVPVFDWVSHIGLIEKAGEQPLTLENANQVIPIASSRLLDLAPLWFPSSPERHVDGRGITIEGTDWFNMWHVAYPWSDFVGLISWVEGQVDALRSWRPPREEKIIERRLDQQTLIERYGDTPVAGHITEPLEASYPTIGLENYIFLLEDQPDLVQSWLESPTRTKPEAD